MIAAKVLIFPTPGNRTAERQMVRLATRNGIRFWSEQESGFNKDRPRELLRSLTMMVAQTEVLSRLTEYETNLIKEILCWIPCGIL